MASTQITKQEAESHAPEALNDGPQYVPLVDIVETDAGYQFFADLPGVKAGDLDVTYANDTLTLEARVAPRQAAGQKYLAQEYGVGAFRRSFRIVIPIDPSAIRAELKNGELRLDVPKAASARLKKITVKTA